MSVLDELTIWQIRNSQSANETSNNLKWYFLLLFESTLMPAAH